MSRNSRTIAIDGRGHLLGHLASVVAKQLINNNCRVVVLRAEDINISGSLYRNKLKYMDYLRKRCNVNPLRGPFHFRAPSMMLRRVVRGMLPHKTRRGSSALLRLRSAEGVPLQYQRVPRVVVPSAMRRLRLRPGRAYCDLGRLAHEVGWKYQRVVKTLEARRRVRDHVYTKRLARKQKEKRMVATRLSKNVQLKRIDQELASLGCLV